MQVLPGPWTCTRRHSECGLPGIQDQGGVAQAGPPWVRTLSVSPAAGACGFFKPSPTFTCSGTSGTQFEGWLCKCRRAIVLQKSHCFPDGLLNTITASVQ